MAASNRNSLQTILTYDNKDPSQWSVVWSTTHIPGMDNATGAGARTQHPAGRRRLRIGSLALGGLLTMHTRVAASALTGGFYIPSVVFMLFLIGAVMALANPLRHFEVYLGQWSISGPGRAFRIIPLLDGIGIAICINAIVRAITCCTVAAMAAIYLINSAGDGRLPYTLCRTFELKQYEPSLKNVKNLMLQQTRFSLETGDFDEETSTSPVTVGLYHLAWRNISFRDLHRKLSQTSQKIHVCGEIYKGGYPYLFRTPAYNYFYVELVHLRSDYSFGQFNVALILSLVAIWIIIWLLMVIESISHGRLIWNNMYSWFVGVPWLWGVVLVVSGVSNLIATKKGFIKVFKVGSKELLAGIADALEVALYIHSSGVGTELIQGKGLNRYASGHIDPKFHDENVWHSGLLVLLTGLQTGGAALCAIVDYIQPDTKCTYNMYESTMWILPMYSKCTSQGDYSHLKSSLIFGGLAFSYMAVAFVMIKTALHTIFEYRVKLVFVEQVVVGSLILSCLGLSLLFTTNGGLPLLESIDAIMTGVSMPFVCLMELIALLYVYRSHDFISDMNVATEDSSCSTRIGVQWQIIPLVTLITLVLKIIMLCNAEMPPTMMAIATVPLVATLLAIPFRALHNAYVFLRPPVRRGT